MSNNRAFHAIKRRTALGLLGGAIASCATLRPTRSNSQTAVSPSISPSVGNSSDGLFTGNPSTAAVSTSIDYFGLNIGTELNWQTWRDQLFMLYSDAGIRWLRVWYNWASLEKQPGVYGDDWTLASLWMAKNLGFKILFVVWGTPPHAGNGDLGSMPNPTALTNYCRWLKEEYGDLVDAWEVGNEPNLTKYYSGSPVQYVNTLATAYRVLRGNKPVVAAGPSGAATPDYWNALLSNGMERHCDRVNLHPYRNQPRQVLHMVDQFLNRVNKPLWITELGLATNVGGEQRKADFVSQVLPALTTRAEKVFWYRSIQGDGLHPLDYGLMEADRKTSQVTPLPAYQAYVNCVHQFSNS